MTAGFTRGETAEDEGATVVECLEVRALSLSSLPCKEGLVGADPREEDLVETLVEGLAEELLAAKGTAESDFGEDAVVARLETGACGGDCLCSSMSHCGTCLI